MNWKNEPLLSWLSCRSLPWANNRILDWNDAFPRGTDVDAMRFVIERHHNPDAKIDMRTVVGQRDHYAGQTWLEALCSPQYKPGKMQGVITRADDNPNYYFSGAIQRGIQLSSIDGVSWYSDTGGNHRTVIGKFLSEMHFDKKGEYPLVAGVSLTRYVIDWESHDLFKKLLTFKDYGIHVSLQPREAGSCLIFHVGDFRFSRRGKFEHLTAEQFCTYAKWIINNDAKLTKLDKLQHWRQFWFGNQEKLVFFS